MIRESQSRLDAKFVQYQVKKGQEAAKALKRVRREKPYTYRRKRNEEQAVFNEKVEDTLVAAQTDIEDAQASAALDKAKKSLEEGVRLLAEWQKLTKVADRSEHGWGALMA